MEINLHFNTNDINLSEENSTSELNNDPSVSNHIHLMPCSIDYDGEAAVDQYFDKYVTMEKNSNTSEIEYNGSFRGYPLRGNKATAPDGYSFVLMKEMKMEEESRTLKESQRFDHFTYWNVSDKPSSRDPFYKAMKWVDASRIIHDN